MARLLAHVGGQQPQAVVRAIGERHRAPATDLAGVVGVEGRQPETHRVSELGVTAQEDLAGELQRLREPIAVELTGVTDVVTVAPVDVVGAQDRCVVVGGLEARDVAKAVAVAPEPVVARSVGQKEEEQPVVTDEHPVAVARATIGIGVVTALAGVVPLVPPPLVGLDLLPVLRRVVRIERGLRADDGIDVRQVFDDADVGPLGPARRVVGGLEAVVDQQQVLRRGGVLAAVRRLVRTRERLLPPQRRNLGRQAGGAGRGRHGRAGHCEGERSCGGGDNPELPVVRGLVDPSDLDHLL